MATLIQGHLPSFLQIFAFVFLVEIIKIIFILNLGKSDAQTENLILDLEKKPNLQDKALPMVYSLMIYKMCEGLNIDVQIAPIEKREIWIRKFNDQRKRKKYIPLVQSEIVFKFCIALNLEVQLSTENGQKEFIQKRKKKSKCIPTVYSTTVYKMCQSLCIEAELNTSSEPTFFNNHIKPKKVIPVVKSSSVYKFCIALGIKARLDPVQDLKC
ncbi:hypothetical protein TNCT_464341 [Trichonephila clavata]|uniref:Uncharacterized protein n=1 Tax=Trichonephila clavata TaxID=2740835 RepID=A0A8X6LF66_TRICU|nr:hypothetical protein TNCT_464341 [Trichonephila clavata]